MDASGAFNHREIATMGTFSVTLSFSNFDEAVTLSPPPDAQVTEGEFTIPGM